MASTFTSNINLEEPARGDDVGTWDTPVNNNMTLLDLVAGGIATISGAAGSVILSAGQFQSKGITFNSTLLASITVTFPTSFKKSYEIYNTCTGSSAFVITLQTTASGGQVVCCPLGEIVDVVNDGTNIRFKSLGRVGSYWDYAGSSVPAWVSGCTVPPYLNCDGSTFSATTYPQLAVVLGSTTLPDFRGRLAGYLNQGTGRITSGTSTGGVDGNTAYASGGSQTTTLSSQNMPPIHVTDPGHAHQVAAAYGDATAGRSNGIISAGSGAGFTAGNTLSATTGISAGNASPTNFSNLPPMTIGGLRLVRAA